MLRLVCPHSHTPTAFRGGRDCPGKDNTVEPCVCVCACVRDRDRETACVYVFANVSVAS